MPATVAAARAEFIKHMNRDNVAVERPRMVAVLDAVLSWSAERPHLVRFRPDTSNSGAIRFEVVATSSTFWMAVPRRENAPVLRLLPGASDLISEDIRADAVQRLNAHTREQNPAGRMHIGFGALKNPDGRAAVFALMDELLGQVKPRAKAPKASLPVG